MLNQEENTRHRLWRDRYGYLLEYFKKLKASGRGEKAPDQENSIKNYGGNKMVYILRFTKRPDFSGFFAGVDFCNGIGSTSSPSDRDRLVDEFGCKDITEESKAKKPEGGK